MGTVFQSRIQVYLSGTLLMASETGTLLTDMKNQKRRILDLNQSLWMAVKLQ